MNRPGAGPQALRNIPGNVFQSQQPSAPRANSLGGSRLQQNGKMGSGSGWAFGGGLGNAAAPQNSQARPGASSITSFAQTIGGAQNQASLDPSMPPKARRRYIPLDLGRSPALPPDTSHQDSENWPQRSNSDGDAPVQDYFSYKKVTRPPSDPGNRTLIDAGEVQARQAEFPDLSDAVDAQATRHYSSGATRSPTTSPAPLPARQSQHWVPASTPRRLSRSWNNLFPSASSTQSTSTISPRQHPRFDDQQAVAGASSRSDHEMCIPPRYRSQTDRTFQAPISRPDLTMTQICRLRESTDIVASDQYRQPEMSEAARSLNSSHPPESDRSRRTLAQAQSIFSSRTSSMVDQLADQNTSIWASDPVTHARRNALGLGLTLNFNSEFPSLSGAPQAQQQNPSAIWSSQNLRASSTQRQQSQTPSHSQQASLAPHTQQPQRGVDQSEAPGGGFPPLGNGGSGVDDLRFDDRATIARPSRTPGQQGSGDDFPPLGGLGDADPRQTAANQPRFNGAGNGLYGQQQQQQSQVRGFGQDASIDGLAAPSAPGNLMSPSNIGSGAPSQNRHLPESGMDGQNSFVRPAQGLGGRLPQGGGLDSLSLPLRGPPPSQGQQGQPVAGEASNPAAADSHSRELQQMSEVDRWGLSGYLSQLKSGFQDHVGLRLGMDLNTLGLDLHRPEPLWAEWAGPFGQTQTQPIVPDFRLPAAYSVHNVPPLHTKISSFSDETLFAIFYGCPRDVSQELAATELYARDWRWHKKMAQWMMKAKEFGEPVQLPSNKEERGWYYFFDVNNWRRERKEFILNYEHLYHGHAGAQMP